DEVLDVLHPLVERELEAAEDPRDVARAAVLVAVEGPALALREVLRLGLGVVVEDGGPAEPERLLLGPVRRRLGHVVEDFEGVEEVVLVALPADGLDAGEVRQLGEETLEDAGLEEDLEPDGRLRRGDDLLELVRDALHAEDLDAGGLLLHRAERVHVDREAAPGGEAGRSAE